MSQHDINDMRDSVLSKESEIFLREPVSRTLDHYEIRPSQIEMMRACSGNIERGGTLMAEAGTGTGKTFAYLIPAILSGKKTLVTTRTINLQEQLVSKDLRFLSSLKEFGYAIAKGRGHYLCKRRLNAFHPSHQEEFDEHTSMLEWVSETETGDIEDYSPRRKPGIWDRICSDPDACKGKKCMYYKECYYFAARMRWSVSSIVVTNHALLAVNTIMPQDSRILPEADVLVIDEAHALDPVFSDQIGIRLSTRVVETIFNRLLRPDERGTYRGLLSQSPVLFPLVESLRMETSLFWQRVRNEVESRRIIRDSFLLKDFLLALSESIGTLLENIKTSAMGLFDEDEEIELKAAMVKLQNVSLEMESFCEEAAGYVRWVDINEKGTALRMSPVYPSEFIKNNLLPEYNSVILTSATLSVKGNFSLIENTLGISDSEKLSVSSPFDIKKQVTVTIKKGIDLRNGENITKLAAVIIDETPREEGGTLILFTSRDVMRKTWVQTAEELKNFGLKPMMQGDYSNRKMLEIMRESNNTVIFGLDSFWEGIDVRGDALKCIIITKLPFEVPTEPIVQARTEIIDSEGGNPFYEYSLPKAVLKFRQGFGRLIRTRTDTGRIVVCDERILTKAYGKSFLENDMVDETIADRGMWNATIKNR
jgi:ATP-dependent DNA helicase DinG